MASSAAKSAPVVVITGTSGAGKGTLVRRLLERMPQLRLAISATTRAQRPGETEGVDYWFIDDAEFDRRLAAGDFLEHYTFPWRQRSGTLLSEIERIRSEGHAPLLELETHGALEVKRRLPTCLTIFVTAPSFEELERRLRARATESAGEIGERLVLARRQLEQAGDFDRVVINDDLERATSELVELISRELASVATMARR